jgi:AraC family transcriptional regulator
VLEGALVKSFPRQSLELGRANAVTIPVGATHGALFGSDGARILIVKPRSASEPVAGCFDRVAELRGRELTWLAWRLAGELRASDAAAPLAAEGFALELLAATTREARPERSPGRPPAWLRSAEELLRARLADRIGLGELAEAVGVHPTYLARAFRVHYGLSVGEYGRRLRLAWAAAELARGEKPLVEIAASAGFADQSHFTRVFRRHVGTTPARYRERAQSGTFQDR